MNGLDRLQILLALCIIVLLSSPNVLISRRSQELGLPYVTLWRLELHLHPCEVQLIQQLSQSADHPHRR